MFNLKSFVNPNSVAFDLGDGNEIYFKNKKDFDLQEFSAWQRLNARLTTLHARKGKLKTEDQFSKTAKEVNAISKEMIFLCLPDLPSDILNSLTHGQVDSLASTCINVAGDIYGRSRIEADTVNKIKEQYSDLPEQFVHTLSRNQAALLIGREEEKND